MSVELTQFPTGMPPNPGNNRIIQLEQLNRAVHVLH